MQLTFMTGIKDLELLLRQLEPELDPMKYVFLHGAYDFADSRVFAVIQEAEGKTSIVKVEDDLLLAREHTLFSRITLQIHSSLEAVGLTAAVSTALAKEGISCNIVAGFFHDHLFVPHDFADRAMKALGRLASA